MGRRLVAGGVGAVIVIAAVVVTLLAMSSGASGPAPGATVQQLRSVRTCAQLRALSTPTYWHVVNTLGPEPCEDDDMSSGFTGLTFRIQSTQRSGDTAYVLAERLCHLKEASRGCNGKRFYFTLQKVDGVWKIDDAQRQDH